MAAMGYELHKPAAVWRLWHSSCESHQTNINKLNTRQWIYARADIHQCMLQVWNGLFSSLFIGHALRKWVPQMSYEASSFFLRQQTRTTHTKWGPRLITIAKLVEKTPIQLWFMNVYDTYNIPVEFFVTKSEASGPLQNGSWLPFCAKFWPWVLPSCKWTPPRTGILHWKCEFVTLQSRPFCRSLEG